MRSEIRNAVRAALRSIVPAAGLIFAAAAAPAQSAAVLGSSNAAYVEGLWRAGYIDLADKMGQLVASSNLPDPEKKAVADVHRKLQIAISGNEGNWAMRRDLILQTLAEKKAQLQAAKPESEAGINALAEVVEQYRLLSDALAALFAEEKDPEKLATMRKEADELYTAAENDLKERKVANEKLKSDEKEGSEIPFLLAFYGLGKLKYYHSLVLQADSVPAKKRVEEALEVLEEFDLEFSDSLAGFEAKLTQALCQQRLGRPELAVDACSDAIALRERFTKNQSGVWQVDKNAADVVSAAVLQKMLFLKDQKEWQKVVDAGKDYFATVSDAMEASQGKAVYHAMGEAHIQLGQTEAAQAIATKLTELDPRGLWGYRGQQLLQQVLSSGSGIKKVPLDKKLDLANSLASNGEYEAALQVCRQVIADAVGEDEKFAAQAMLINGAIYATRGWFHEASVAFDAVVRRYPKSEHAPDALYRSIRCFLELAQQDKQPVFKRWMEDRSKQLVRDYPNDSHVGQLQLLDGESKEKAGKYLDAAKVYEQIKADSVVYHEARFRAAEMYQKQARQFLAGGAPKEAEPLTAKATEGFQSLIKELESARNTAQEDQKSRLEKLDFRTRVALINLYLAGKSNVAEADKLLADMAKLVKEDDKDRMPVIWSLRIRSKLAQDQVDEAATAMEGVLSKFPQAQSPLAVCSNLATALDAKAVASNKKNEFTAASTLWRQAVGYYMKSAKVTGVEPSEVAQIADRLRVIGLCLNGVDEKVDGWFEAGDFRAKNTEAWEAALTLYTEIADGGHANYRTRIGKARILGFLGRINECEAELAQLFANEKIVGAQGRVNAQLIQQKPELLTAYLEWGFALRAATGGDEKSRRARASEIFGRVGASVPADGKHWWYSRYGQILTFYERGLYDEADVSISSLERTNPDFDGDRFGLKVKYRNLKAQIRQKVPNRK